MSKMRFIAVVLVVCLLIANAGGTTFAYLTDSSSTSNVFTSGNIKVTLSSPTWSSSDNAREIAAKETVTPGTKITATKGDCYFAISLKFIDLDTSLQITDPQRNHEITELFTNIWDYDGYFDTNNATLGVLPVTEYSELGDYYYTYKGILQQGTSVTLIDELDFSSSNVSVLGNFKIVVSAYAVQAFGFTYETAREYLYNTYRGTDSPEINAITDVPSKVYYYSSLERAISDGEDLSFTQADATAMNAEVAAWKGSGYYDTDSSDILHIAMLRSKDVSSGVTFTTKTDLHLNDKILHSINDSSYSVIISDNSLFIDRGMLSAIVTDDGNNNNEVLLLSGLVDAAVGVGFIGLYDRGSYLSTVGTDYNASYFYGVKIKPLGTSRTGVYGCTLRETQIDAGRDTLNVRASSIQYKSPSTPVVMCKDAEFYDTDITIWGSSSKPNIAVQSSGTLEMNNCSVYSGSQGSSGTAIYSTGRVNLVNSNVYGANRALYATGSSYISGSVLWSANNTVYFGGDNSSSHYIGGDSKVYLSRQRAVNPSKLTYSIVTPIYITGSCTLMLQSWTEGWNYFSPYFFKVVSDDGACIQIQTSIPSTPETVGYLSSGNTAIVASGQGSKIDREGSASVIEA